MNLTEPQLEIVGNHIQRHMPSCPVCKNRNLRIETKMTSLIAVDGNVKKAALVVCYTCGYVIQFSAEIIGL